MRSVVHALASALVVLGSSTLAGVAAVPAGAADEASEAGARMILVLDASGSMKQKAEGGTKIQAARTALSNVIEALPPEAAVGMRVFGSKVFSRTDAGACEDTALVVPIGTENRAELAAAATAYKPYGETPIPVALREAARDLGATGQRSIVLVSDGESTCGDPCPVAKQISNSGVEMAINVVGLAVSGKARAQLRCIAEATNGTYYDAESAAEIESTLEHVATRALRPFTIGGTPITGGAESAPTPITVGDWRDEFPVGVDELFYSFERAKPDSTLRVSIYTQGQAKELVSTYSVRISGEGCPTSTGLAQHLLDIRSVLGAQATVLGNRCDASGPLQIRVTAPSALTEVVPFGLRVIEEPPLAASGDAASEAPAPTNSAMPLPPAAQSTPVVGGSGFASATEITPGTWSSTIVPGEFGLFRFHLDYGQSADVSITVPPVSAALRDRLGTAGAPLGRMALYSPMWAELGFSNGSEFSERLGLSLSGTPTETTLFSSVPTVGAAGDGGRRSFNAGADTTLAGDYYVGFSAAAQEQSFEFPFTITLRINGTAQPGPTYADGVTWTLADGLAGGPSTRAPEAAETPERNTPDDSGDSGGGTPTALWLGGGAVALVALAGGAVVLARRRSHAAR